jgi:hypothetical protein
MDPIIIENKNTDIYENKKIKKLYDFSSVLRDFSFDDKNYNATDCSLNDEIFIILKQI